MAIVKSTESSIPEPGYTRHLDNQKVLLDVNTLLRGILFPFSHSRRLLQGIRDADNAVAVISKHIRDAAIYALKQEGSTREPVGEF